MHACINGLTSLQGTGVKQDSFYLCLSGPFSQILILWCVYNLNSIKLCTLIELYLSFQDDLLLCQLLCKLIVTPCFGS